MALKSGSLGTLLQGVSQQPARVRLPGQVSAQDNMVSDITIGLSTRPATEQGVYLPGAQPDMSFDNLTFQGTNYVFGWRDDELLAWTDDGLAFPVNLSGIPDMSYVGENMRFHSLEDKILVLNRETVVSKQAVAASTDPNVGLFHAIGGQFSKTYSVTVTFSDSTVITEEYETPDGTTSGDAELVTSVAIIKQLVDQFNTTAAFPAGTQISRASDVARIVHPTLTFTITTSDGEAGVILRSVSSQVKEVSDLPRYAPNGTIVEVVTSEADEDDYWLRFQAEGTTVVNGYAGFGNEGTWYEWYNPNEDREFDLDTMPHQLVLNGSTFDMSHAEWGGRTVGDEDTAPFPSIVGKRIRDIGGFESRVVLLSEQSVVMTRTNQPLDLWRESVTVLAATDPIDLTSTKKDSLRLDWIVPFDRDLFLIADPGDSQFIIRGGGLTPTNGSMVLTTEFEVNSDGTVPVSTGRTILLPFRKGAYSGLKEFYTDSDNAANAADSLTEAQDRYIEGLVSKMSVSQNFNLAVLTSGSMNKRLWVYKYLWDKNEILQSSWSTWTFQDNILHFYFDGSDLNFISMDNAGVYVHKMDLNRPFGEFGYHLMLDRKDSGTVTDGYIELSYANARFQQSTGCANPGLEVEPDNITRLGAAQYRYYLPPGFAPTGSQVHYGQGVPWSLEPSQVYAKDYRDNVDTSKKVTIQDYVVHIESSGAFDATGSSPYSDDWTIEFQLFPYDNEPDFDTSTLTYSGTAVFPWGERADWSTLTLHGDDLRPVTILEVEWNGQIINTKGRRA